MQVIQHIFLFVVEVGLGGTERKETGSEVMVTMVVGRDEEEERVIGDGGSDGKERRNQKNKIK